MVANADLGESFVQRLRSMIPATIVIPAMTALGLAIGSHRWVTVAVGAVVILVGGFIAAVGREAALFGTFFAIAFVVVTHGISLSAGRESRQSLARIEQLFALSIRDVESVARHLAIGLDARLGDVQATIGNGLQHVVQKTEPIRGFDANDNRVGGRIVVDANAVRDPRRRREVFVP